MECGTELRMAGGGVDDTMAELVATAAAPAPPTLCEENALDEAIRWWTRVECCCLWSIEEDPPIDPPMTMGGGAVETMAVLVTVTWNPV